MNWDKEVAAKLRKLDLNQEQIGAVIGILADHRQEADRCGYKRGYESAFENIKIGLDVGEFCGKTDVKVF